MCVGQICFIPLLALHYSDSLCDHGVNMSLPVLMMKSAMLFLCRSVQDRMAFIYSCNNILFCGLGLEGIGLGL